MALGMHYLLTTEYNHTKPHIRVNPVKCYTDMAPDEKHDGLTDNAKPVSTKP